MKRRLKENIEIGDRVFAPKDEFEGTVIDINGDEVLVDGPFGEEYHNLNDLEKLGGDYEDEAPDFFNKYYTESTMKRKKTIRLTESDLIKVIKKIIKEEETVDGSQDAYQYIYDKIKSSTTGHKTNGVYFGNNKTPRNVLKWNYSGLSVDDKKPFAIELIPNFDKDIPNVKRIGDKKASEALLIIHIKSKGNNTQEKFNSISNYLSPSEKFYDYGHEGYKTKVYIIDKSNENNAIKVINNLTKK